MKTKFTSENETYGFIRCATYQDAIALFKELQLQGKSVSIGDDTRGWYVRVQKT